MMRLTIYLRTAAPPAPTSSQPVGIRDSPYIRAIDGFNSHQAFMDISLDFRARYTHNLLYY